MTRITRPIGYAFVALVVAALVWLGFRDQIVAASVSRRFAAGLHAAHSESYWRDRIVRVPNGMGFQEIVEILPPNSSSGSLLIDSQTQEFYYDLDSEWAVTMLVEVTTSENPKLLGKPELMRHDKSFGVGGCLIPARLRTP